MKDKLLLNANDTAATLGISRSFLYEQVSMSRIPAPIKIGKKSLWSVESLTQWIKNEQTKIENKP